MDNRLQATVVTVAVLTAAFFGYARLTAPFLRVEPARQIAVRQPAASTRPARSPDFQSLANRWFPEDSWVRSAGKRFRDQQRYLYFDDFELLNQNHSMKVSPIAVLWMDDDEEQRPITVTANSAQLDRSSAFRLEEGEFGRITSGALFGDVTIRGPDGLRIDARNFHISEKEMKMWTNQPVDFAWGDHTGRAESGVEIKLLGAPDENSGLLSVSDIQSVTMLGRVVCDLQIAQGDDEPDLPVRINAANGFEYFVPTRTARFSGFPDRELTPANQIVVQRTTASGGLDQLFCSQLSLYFQPRVDESGTDSRRLEIQRLDAEGSRVVYYSPENELTAWMTNVRYRVPERTLQLWRRGTDSAGLPLPVRIRQRDSELLATRIDAVQDQSGQVRLVECRGAGSLAHRSDQPSQWLDVGWKESFTWFNEHQPRMLLQGDATVRQPHADLVLGAATIEMALQAPDASAAPGAGPATEHLAPLDLSTVRPRVLTASGDITLTSGAVTGTLQRQLTVKFAEPQPATTPGTPVHAASASTDAAAAAGRPAGDSPVTTRPERTSDGITRFSGESLDAVVQLADDASGSGSRLTDVWLKGSVVVDHVAADPAESFRAEGNVVFAAAGLEGSRQIQLFGDPATVVNTDRRIEGQRIDLEESQQEARVEGSGKLRIVVDRGLDGRPLPRPTPLDVFWSRHMTFVGREAHFVGDIRAVMKDGETHHLQITCDGMRVRFTGDPVADRVADPSGAASSRNGVESEIESITCESLVTVSVSELMAGTVEATHRAEFSDFHVNLISGDFRAQGPGWIESTQPDHDNQLRVAPEVTARANTPVRTPDNSYVFLRASFIGTLSGNLNDQLARLENHVSGVFGPVRRLGDRLELDAVDTSRLPDQSGVLRCEQMTVAVIPGPVADRTSFSLSASVNARLESRRFSGDADRITYDHAKQQFILRSEGDTLATVSHRPGHSREVRSLVGKRFEYYPGRNRLTASQITGVQAAQ